MWVRNLFDLITQTIEFYIDGVWAPRFCYRRGHTPYKPFRNDDAVHCKVCWIRLDEDKVSWADVGKFI